MNCANHPDIEKVAFCRTCGKPLCANCTRSVHGVIYCETCLAARLEGVQPNVAPPAAGFVPATPVGTPVAGAGPNPALAGVLAGFFPFGVGAVYTGQYAKGLAHLVIFTLLILGASSGSDAMGTVFGLAIAGFYFYQIIDSVRSARALQMGLAPPDPFGLATTFSAGERVDVSKVPGRRPGPHRPGRDLPAAYPRHLGFQRAPHLASCAHWHRRLVAGATPGPGRRSSARIRPRAQLQARLDGAGHPVDPGISVSARQHGRNPLRPHPAAAAGGDRTGKDFPEYGWPGSARGTAAIKWSPAFRIYIRRGAAPVIPGSEAGGEKWLARCKPRPQLSIGRDSDVPWPVR